MPESKGRAKASEKLASRRARALAERRGENAEEKIRLSGARNWVPWVFVPLFLIGVIWLVVFYIAGRDIPVMSSLGDANILVALGFILAGFVVSTAWK
ncbi:MAG: cell division protein CrgA [Propionibacteriaceae bacterium]|nr:cell division protein CrgA [Propionibacteriaceae bacterium]